MADCLDDPGIVEEPLWQMNLLDYDKEELETLVSYIDQTRAWFNAHGVAGIFNQWGPESEDVVGLKVGIPSLTPTDISEVAALYAANNDTDQLVRSVSLDALKISTKVVRDGVTYSQPYTFKSAFNHTRYSGLFTEGVDNKTGFTYLDNYSMNSSATAGMAVRYNGSPAKLLPPLPVPAHVYGCMVYVLQNASLYTKFVSEPVDRGGDIIYYSSDKFYNLLLHIRQEALSIISKVATPYEEEIYELLISLGMDKAFKDIQFGGDFAEMRLAMRIPASRNNQALLEGLMSQHDVFEDIFKVKAITHEDRDIEASEKKEDLNDPFSGSKNGQLIDTVPGGYGCKGLVYKNYGDGVNYTSHAACIAGPPGSGIFHCVPRLRYRYWYIDAEWYDSLTTEQKAIVFWMGLDIVTSQNEVCELDEILAVIIVIIVTYFTAGLGSGTALTMTQGLAVLSGIISIASITGVIDAETAAALTLLLAVVSLGTSVATTSIGSRELFMQAINVANMALETLTIVEASNTQDKLDDMTEQIEALEDDAALWETNFRFMYGGAFEMTVRDGPEADPYKFHKDMYKDFSIYTTPGFM